MKMAFRYSIVIVLSAVFFGAFGKPPKKLSETNLKLSTYSAPFDFHGIQLGSTMKQFYGAQQPDFDNGSNLHQHDAKSVCSNGVTPLPTGIHHDPIDEQYGGGACGWGFDLLGDGHLNEAFFRVGDEIAVGVFRYIAMPGEDQAKLYQIHIQVPNDAMDSIVNGLTSKFGAPTERRIEQWQNKIGGRFDNIILIWKNAVSQIIFRQLALSIDEGSIDYILNDHYVYKNSFKQITDQARDAGNM